MNYAQVEEGEVFLMGRGEGNYLDYASGLYRATADLDLRRLYGEYRAREGVHFYTDDVTLLFGEEEHYLYHRDERFFQEWLLESGHVERVPCKLLSLSAETAPASDGSGDEAVMVSTISDPFPETSATLSTSPGR